MFRFGRFLDLDLQHFALDPPEGAEGHRFARIVAGMKKILPSLSRVCLVDSTFYHG